MLAIPLEPTDIEVLEAHPRNGTPQVSPTFTEEATYLHPVPTPLLGEVQVGERWAGRFGRLHRPTSPDGMPKVDRRGRPLYVRYFIPLRKVGDDAQTI